MALTYYDNWLEHQHPVTTGRAPWLPAPFEESINVCRNARAEQAAVRSAKAGR